MLHIINSSPFNDHKLQLCLAKIDEQDGLLLIGEGVYGLNQLTEIRQQLPADCPLYVLQDDAFARGLHCDSDNIEWLDYSGFVELTLRYTNLISW